MSAKDLKIVRQTQTVATTSQQTSLPYHVKRNPVKRVSIVRINYYMSMA